MPRSCNGSNEEESLASYPSLQPLQLQQQQQRRGSGGSEGGLAKSLTLPVRPVRTAVPPRLMQKSKVLTRVYYVNYAWKSVISKALVVCYMAHIWWVVWKESSPWYEFFYYLTLQGWTIELVYFTYSLYLDLRSRWLGGPDQISRIAKAAAQALSELVFALQVVIVLFFWLVVYPQETWRSIPWELNMHGVGLLLVVGDYLYRFTSFSLRNHKYVVMFALGYTAWYSFVVLALKKKVYPGIDFKSVKSVVVFSAGLSTVVLTHKIVYLLTNWPWIKEDLKSVIGVGQVLLLRQNSIDLLTRGFSEFSSELLSISPRTAGPFKTNVKHREWKAAAAAATREKSA